VQMWQAWTQSLHGSVVHADMGRSRRRCGKGENVCRRALLPLHANAVDQREQMRMACRIAARCAPSIARLHGCTFSVAQCACMACCLPCRMPRRRARCKLYGVSTPPCRTRNAARWALHVAGSDAARGGSTSCSRCGVKSACNASSVIWMVALPWACIRIALAAATSTPGLGSPLPHLRRDRAHPSHICTATRLTDSEEADDDDDDDDGPVALGTGPWAVSAAEDESGAECAETGGGPVPCACGSTCNKPAGIVCSGQATHQAERD
jgi:hypothetical protein